HPGGGRALHGHGAGGPPGGGAPAVRRAGRGRGGLPARGGGGPVTRLVVVGDALLDRGLAGGVDRVCPDAPVPVVDQRADRARPGGAGLAAALLAGDGTEVTLITALARDAAGEELRTLLAAAGVAVVDLGSDGATAEKIRVRAGQQSL